MSAQNSSSSVFRTVLTITTGFLLLFWWKQWDWALWIAVLVGLAGIVSTSLARYIHRGWMKLAWLLGLVIPKIVLTIIFFGLLWPLAQLARWLGPEDPLELKNSCSSLWKPVEKEYDPSFFEKPW